ncbi:hypothetical protein [Rubellimicrobium arenae]|uniref:hypothetical protein n=1 Tax=Rubellimicrobium arenae TaxID=2817372 RepID=UPI001B30D339|nr:hypothetical protein [Rubellimicrobium arenae]
MATVTLTARFSQLDSWPGNLFDASRGAGTEVTLRSATQLKFTLGPGTDFEGYSVVVSGTGFSYLDGVAVAGTMSQVRVADDRGRTLVTFGDLAGGTPVSKDLSQFYSNVFGSEVPDAGPWPNSSIVWDHLMTGNDVIRGTSGDDWETLAGADVGQDIYDLGAGDDQVEGGIGNDTYNGGGGFDRLTFRDTTYNNGITATRGAVIDLRAGTVTDPWGGRDRINGIEAAEGSRFGDVFRGRADRDDEFSGLRGRDSFNGGRRSYVDGQPTDDGHDRVQYDNDYWQGGWLGIRADLETSFSKGSIRGTIRDGFGNVDTVTDIEDVVGTRFGDSFIGSRADNAFQGGEGRDTYQGGAGHDRLEFRGSFVGPEPSGIRVDLSLAAGQIIDDGFGNKETAIGIEQITGSDGNDRIRGSARADDFEGARGADSMTGGGGSDTFIWWEEDHLDRADRITDFSGNDHLAFRVENFDGMTSTLRLVNGTAATTGRGTFVYNDANDTLYWDRDGTGGASARAVAVLAGVESLSASNFELWV